MKFTDNLERRTRALFRFFDVKKNGFLNKEDEEAMVDNICKLYGTDPSASEVMKKEVAVWWSEGERFDINNKLDEDKFVMGMKKLFKEDFNKMRKKKYRLYEMAFDLMDRNKNQKLSVAEFLKFYAAFNVNDTDRVTKIFKKIDVDGNGFITRDEWILARIDYDTRDDPNHDYGFMMDFSSPPSSEPGVATFSPTMENRIKSAFHFHDVNGDGVISHGDFSQMTENLLDKFNAGPETREKARASVMQWWHNMEPMAVSGEISEERFVAMHRQAVAANYDKWRHHLIKGFRAQLDMVDHDGKGTVSKAEFMKFYAAFNIKNTEKVKEIFKKIDLDEDGQIDGIEWILANLDYFTREDPNYDYGFLFDVK